MDQAIVLLTDSFAGTTIDLLATVHASDQSAVVTVVADDGPSGGSPGGGDGRPLPRPDVPELRSGQTLALTGIAAVPLGFLAFALMFLGTVLIVFPYSAETAGHRSARFATWTSR